MTNPFVGNDLRAPSQQPTNPFSGNTPKQPDLTPELDVSVEKARKANPERTAQALALSRRVNLPADVVERNLEEIQRLAGDRTFKPEEFASEFPTTTRWLTDPTNAAVAKDDYEGLGRMERLIGRWQARTPVAREGMVSARPGGDLPSFRSPLKVQAGLVEESFENGMRQWELLRMYGATRAADRDAAFRQRADSLRALQRDLPDVPLWSIEGALRGFASNVAPSLVNIIPKSIAGAGVGAAMGAASTGATVAGVPLGVGAGAALGAGLGGYRETLAVGRGAVALWADEVRDKNGNPLPADVQDALVDVFGPTLGVVEIAAGGAIMSRIGAGISAVALRAGVQRGVSDALTKSTVRRALTEGLRVGVASAAIETGEEVVAEATQIVAEQTGRILGNLRGGEFGPVEDVTERLTATAVETFVSSLVLGGLAGGSVTIGGSIRAMDAQAEAERFAEMVGVSDALNLKKRDPASLEILLQEQIRAAGAPEAIGVPADRILEQAQAQGFDVAEFAQLVGTTPDAIQEAVAAGQDVMLPVAKVLANLTQTPAFAALQEDFRFRVGLPTIREAKAQEAEFTAAMEEVKADLEKAVKDADDPAQRIVDDMVAQVTAASAGLPKSAEYTPQNIEAMAKTAAAFYSVVAKRQGRDAFELYRERNYRILGPEDAQRVLTLRRDLQRAVKKGDLQAASAVQAELAAMVGAPMTGEPMTQEALPDTIEVDGVQRPTTNSNGQPIHPTRQGIINFWRWFGDSKVVDAEGRPLVVYHSTAADITTFEMRGKSKGFFFSPSSSVDMTSRIDVRQPFQTGANVMPVYLKIENPQLVDVSAFVSDAVAGIRKKENDAIKAAKKQKHDGLITALDGDPLNFIAFENTQIKSAIGNTGAFGPTANILEQAPVLSSEAVDAYYADEAHSLMAQRDGATARDIAEEMLVPVRDVERWLSKPRPELDPEELRRTMLLLAFRPDAILEQAAFHGTPHTFDRFDLSKIGTGEGAQAYGWGLYFAENEGVARGYRRNLAPTEVEYPTGVTIDTNNASDWVQDAAKYLLSADGDYNAAIAAVQARHPNGGTFGDEVLLTLEEWRRVGVRAREGGSLYRVDIPDEAVARFLDWDKPLSESEQQMFAQSVGNVQIVQRSAGDFGLTKVGENGVGSVLSGGYATREQATAGLKDIFGGTGSDAYRTLTRILGSQEAASKALLAAGIPGIKYLDAGSRGTGDGTRNLVVFDDALVTITHRNGEPVTAQERTDFLAQMGTPEQMAAQPNAFIIPGVSQQTIGLMNTANLSSLMHELSHDWLRILQADAMRADASEQTKADWATIVKHLGIHESGELTVEAQEKWARDFERYLATAEAPSRGLARAFVRFKGWMAKVYQRVKAMLLPVDPEIAGVFDRMLATEDELRLTRRANGAEPIVVDDAAAETLGLSPEALREYRKAWALDTAEQNAALLKDLLAERSDEFKKVKREAEARIREDVQAEIGSQPVYQTIRYLTTGEIPPGVQMAGTEKLNRPATEAVYGDIAKSLPRGIWTDEGGLDADALALAFGFRDGFALIEAMQQATPRNQANPERAAVDAEVRRRMAIEFPDPMQNSAILQEKAQDVAHRASTDDPIVRDLTLLGKAAGIRPPNVPAIKAVAKQMVGQMAVKDIRPVAFQNAEATAARKSGEAMKAGDLPTAAFHKRQQLLNHILYREAKHALAMADRAQAFARRMEATPAQARLGKAGQAYQDAMNAILDAYEFRNVSRPQMAAQERLRAQVAAWAEEVSKTYTVETEDQKVVLIQPSVPDAVLDAPMNYRYLPADRVQELYDAMKQIYHTASGLDKELRQQNAMRFAERVELLVETATKNWTPNSPGFVQSQGVMDKLAEDLDAKHGEMIKVEMLARLLDGDKPNGPWQQALTNYAAESQSAFNRDMEAFYDRYKAAMDRIPKERIKGFFQQLVEVPGVAGQGTDNPRITGQQVFHLLLNYGNESSRNAVNAGEYLNGYRPYTDANVRKLVALLTPEEMQAAQEVWDAVSMFWDRMAELQREMTGITPKKVPASQIVLQAADGSSVTLKGGYFPLKYDTRFSAKAFQQELTRGEQTAEGLTPFLGSARTTTEQGHLIERQDANGRIVDLSPEVVARHMTAAVYDLTHRRMVYDVQKIVLNPRIADIVQRTAGVGAYRKALLPWARRLAGEKGPPQTWVAKAALRARAGASTMGLGFRATTILLQYLGVGQTMALLGPKYTARGFREIIKYQKGAFEAADALAPELAFRQLSFNRDLAEVARNMKAKGTWNGVYETAFAGIAFMDRQVSIASFWGGYYQWLDANPTDVAGAVRAGEQAVRLSQGANNAKDLAALMASNDPLTRTLTSFFSNGSVLYQLFWRATRQAKGKQGKAAFLTSMLAAWMLPAVIEPLMRGQGPEENDELEDKIAWWFWQITSYPMQALPLARDLARMLEPGKPKMFREFAPPFLRPFSELGYSLVALGEVMGEDEIDAKDIEVWLKTLGYWANLPLDAPWGMSERLYQWMTGEVSPDNPLQGARFVLTNAPIR